MPSPESKHTVLRIASAGSIAALGIAGVAIGKTIIEELSKPKASALEVKQPGGIAPSQKAFNELVTFTPSPSPSLEPTAQSTAIPTETPKTPTPEKQPIFSKLFPGIDVSSAEIIPYKEGGNEFELVGITLPPGTDLTAHTDLEVSKLEARAPFSGSDAFLDIPEDADIGSVSIIGNFEFVRKTPKTEKIKAGNKYATTIETDGKNLQGKTIIVWISEMDRSTKKFFTPKELVEKYFPGIDSQPKSQQVDYQGPVKSQTIYKYFGGPNDK